MKGRERGAQRRTRIVDEMTPASRRIARLGSSCALLASLLGAGLHLGGVIELGAEGWVPFATAAASLASLIGLRPRSQGVTT